MAEADNPLDGYEYVGVAFGGTQHGAWLSADTNIWEKDDDRYIFTPIIVQHGVGTLVAIWISETCRDKSLAQITHEMFSRWAEVETERMKTWTSTSKTPSELSSRESSTPPRSAGTGLSGIWKKLSKMAQT